MQEVILHDPYKARFEKQCTLIPSQLPEERREAIRAKLLRAFLAEQEQSGRVLLMMDA